MPGSVPEPETWVTAEHAPRYDAHPSELRPILPCYRSAFVAFEAMVEHGAAPPPDQTVPRTAGGGVANHCPLRAAASAKPRLVLRVRPRRARAGRRTRLRMTRRPVRAGRRTVVATKRGYRRARIRVVVRR